MRELIFKNLTVPNSKKRNISMEEIVHKNGLVSSTKKQSTYFLKEIHRVKSKEELTEWIDKRKKDPISNKKFFHILREYSDRDHEDKLMCKMRGSFYIISGSDVLNIVFVHTIKISINKNAEVK